MTKLSVRNYDDKLSDLLSRVRDEAIVAEMLDGEIIIGEIHARRVIIDEFTYTAELIDVNGKLETTIGEFDSVEDAVKHVQAFLDHQEYLFKMLAVNEDELYEFSKKIGVELPYSLYQGSNDFMNSVFGLMTNEHNRETLEQSVMNTATFTKTAQYDELPEFIKERINKSLDKDQQDLAETFELAKENLLRKINEQLSRSSH